MLGFFSFTEITDPAGHRTYNEWHQLDHLPEQFSIDGIFFGQRWVCTPRCAGARVVVSGRLAPCHYMTLYLMRDERPLPEFYALGQQLRDVGRFFEARVSHLSGPFEVVRRTAAPAAVVSGEAIPFRPAAGIYVVVGAAPLSIGCDEMLHVPGVAGAWEFGPSGAARGDEARSVVVAWVDGDLWDVAGALGERCQASGGALEWAGPLERVDPFAWDWFE